MRERLLDTVEMGLDVLDHAFGLHVNRTAGLATRRPFAVTTSASFTPPPTIPRRCWRGGPESVGGMRPECSHERALRRPSHPAHKPPGTRVLGPQGRRGPGQQAEAPRRCLPEPPSAELGSYRQGPPSG